VAHNTISLAQLQELQKSGAVVEIEKRPMIIEGFSDLIESLKGLIAAQEAQATADLKRSQTQLEVLATLQALIKQNASGNRSHPVDLSPLHTVLSEMKETGAREPCDYDFKILRSGPGLSPATKIEVRVVRPTLN
jgi:hypothetical protein